MSGLNVGEVGEEHRWNRFVDVFCCGGRGNWRVIKLFWIY